MNDHILQLLLCHVRQISKNNLTKDLTQLFFTNKAVLVSVERAEQDHELGVFLALVYLAMLRRKVI